MGETYRGLTIRFGGDTTSLQKALQSANAAITVTQSELRKVNSALKFDPTDVVALNVKMELLKERSEGVYEKMNILSRAIRDLGGSATNATELASSMDRVNKTVSETTQRYDALDAAIKATKDEINKMSTVGDVFDKNNKEIDGMVNKFAACSTECAELVAHFRELQSQWHVTSSALDTAKEQSRLAKLATEFVSVQAETRKLRDEFVKLHATSVFNEQEAVSYNARMKDLDATISMVEDESRRLYEALKLDPSSVDTARKYLQSMRSEIELAYDRIAELDARMKSLKSSGLEGLDKSAKQAREEFVRAADELAKWNDEIGKAEAELTDMKKTLTTMLSDQKENTAEYKETEAAVASLEAKVEKLRTKQKEAQDAFDSAQAVTEFKRLETEMAETTAKATKLKTAMSEVGNAAKVSASTFTTLGMALSQNITPYIMIAASYSVEAAQEIDSAYRDMRKTVNGTEKDFESLKDAAMDFASTHVTSADQILEIEAMGGQMGLLVDELDSFAETIANLNVATNISDAAEAAEIIGQLKNILNLTNDEVVSFGDSLVRLGNNNAALESDILEVTSRIGSMGSIMDFTAPEILAWATAIAATGQNSEAAGTAISNTMSDIENAVASGGDSLAAFAEVAGMSADSFAEKWSTKPSDAMQSFIEGLRRIDNEGGSVDATLEGLGITAVRQKQALQGLSQTVGTLDDALSMSKDAWNGVSDQWGEAGDAANEAKKKAEGFSGQLSILTNNAQMLGAEFAESLAPVIGVINTLMQGLYEVTKDMPDGIKLLILSVTGLVAAVGPLATIIGPFATVTNSLNSNMAQLNKTLGGVAKETNAMSAAAKVGKVALGALAAAIAAVVITEVVKYFANLYEQQKNLQKATVGLTTSMDELSISGESVARSAESEGKSLGNLNQKLKDSTSNTQALIKEQADLADSMKSTWTETQTDVALAEHYASIITELAGSYGTNTEEALRLQQAIDGYKNVTGETVPMIEDESGAIAINTAQLAENTENWKKNAEAQALQEMYAETFKQRTKTMLELNDANSLYISLTEQLNDCTDVTSSEFQQLAGKQEAARQNVEKLTKAADASTETLGKLVEMLGNTTDSTSGLANSIDEVSKMLGMSSGEFIDWAVSVGVSTEEGMARVAQAIIDGKEPTLAAVLELTGLTEEEFNATMVAMGLSGTDGIAAFTAAINNGKDPSVAAAMLVTGLTEEEFSKAAFLMNYSGEDGVSRFAAAIANGEISARDAAAAVKDAAVSQIDSGKDMAAQAGDNFGSNFAGGIGNWLGEAATNAANLARSAWEALFGELEINSPSKVAIRAAKGFAKEGFIDTISSYEKEAYKTASLLGKSSVDGLDDGILAMRDAAQANVYRTLSSGTASSVTNNTSNTKNMSITMNVTADSTTTLESLIRQAERAGVAYGRR